MQSLALSNLVKTKLSGDGSDKTMLIAKMSA